MSTAILPLAFTMMAGPQEMTAILFVTHPTPVKVSLAFLTGVTVAMVLETAIFYLLAGTLDLGDPSDRGSSGTVVQLVLAGLLALLAIRTYRRRETIEPPKWLGGMMEASPMKALTTGFVLILVMPTDVITMATVAANLQQNDSSLIDALPFWGLTLLIAALPLLSYLLLGQRAKLAMPKVRDWMFDNSWLVNIIVLGIFIVLILA
jgi:Sap, sulfolipid-1-addressing protein